MRIGLFGGTFDPIHLGHAAMARLAREQARLDQVVFIPCRQNPHKSTTAGATGSQRLKMIELATADLKWARVHNGELKRNDTAPSYSWQTVADFRERLPEADLFWILGTDQWLNIEAWSRARYLADHLTFLVFARNGTQPKPIPGFKMIALEGEHPASSTKIRQHLTPKHLDPKVARYINSERLYQNHQT